ncbi:MAG: YgiQ family radical SAM protein [Bacteroidales bacterium]|nr:MAG: YgiQ family radical SAM protein [Bacteroidales bacterium]
MIQKKDNHSKFLPTSKKEMEALGWEQADVILFSGDAYIDHPSFGAAVIGRVLENIGLRVAIVPQPNWRDDLRDFKKLGAPRLFFGVTSGSMDSMVNHYTANKRLRSDDAYTPDDKSGYRPDYAVTVYSNIIKKNYPDIPLIIGGIEASLRRLTHYDYWSDSLKPSVLIDSGADILVYGMGEKPILEIARRLADGQSVFELYDIPQISFIDSDISIYKSEKETIILNSFEDCLQSKEKFGDNFKVIETESNRVSPQRIVEPIKDKVVVVNPPYPLPTTEEIDSWYDLPYTRLPHPRYKSKVIPAWEMIKFSVNIHRGCFGGCSFCTISAHQGKFISSRSEKSILNEVDKVVGMEGFKGYLSDIGGPSANMYTMKGRDLKKCDACKRPSCIFPNICNNLNTSHENLLSLYRAVRKRDGVKKAFVGSGVRYDLSMNDNDEYITELIRHHVSGRLKVAPEHTSDEVLRNMRKPPFESFKKFNQKFNEINAKYSLNQQLIPYFISSHPGSKEVDMQNLANETKKLDFKLEQIQDFTPTPMTLASTIYYTGIDPYTKKPLFVARTQEQKLKQRNYFFWYQDKEKRSKDKYQNSNFKKKS